MRLIDILKNIENQICAGLQYNDENFNEFLILYEDNILQIFSIFKNNIRLKRIEYLKKNLSQFHIKFSESIKNYDDYLSLVLSIITIKAFVDTTKPQESRGEKYLLYDSDKIINYILIDFSYFIIWLEANYNKNSINKKHFKLDKKNIRVFILDQLMCLHEHNTLKIENRFSQNKWFKLYHINLPQKDFIFLSLFKKSFQYYKKNNYIYFFINHYTNMHELTRENPRSGSVFTTGNMEYLNNLLKIKCQIDYSLLEWFYQKKLEKYNLNSDKLFEYYHIYIQNIKDAIRTNDYKTHKELSEKLSIVIDLLRIKKIINNNFRGDLYFPSLLCFRGRTHFTSSVSFTFFKEFRFVTHQGSYEENFSPPFHPLSHLIENILENYIDKLNTLKNFNFEKKNKQIKYSIIWVLISIGKLDKSKMGQQVNIEDFINRGIEIMNNQITINLEDEYEELELESLKKILGEINSDIYIKRFISKDATASCFQHLIKILGHSNSEARKWCNLDSLDTWYDTYTFILNNWLSGIKYEGKDNLLKFFTRKSTKRVDMTTQYGCSEATCWKYFKETIKIESLSPEEINDLRTLFKNFYEYVDSNVGLLNRDSKDIIEALLNNKNEIILSDNSQANLNYYKIKKSQIVTRRKNIGAENFLNKEIRYTKSHVALTGDFDYKKHKTSSRANYIHIQDASIARYVISIAPILTIHDCFLIDYQSVTFLISLVNEAMRKTFHDLKLNTNFKHENIFSIFIVL